MRRKLTVPCPLYPKLQALHFKKRQIVALLKAKYDYSPMKKAVGQLRPHAAAAAGGIDAPPDSSTCLLCFFRTRIPRAQWQALQQQCHAATSADSGLCGDLLRAAAAAAAAAAGCTTSSSSSNFDYCVAVVDGASIVKEPLAFDWRHVRLRGGRPSLLLTYSYTYSPQLEQEQQEGDGEKDARQQRHFSGAASFTLPPPKEMQQPPASAAATTAPVSDPSPAADISSAAISSAAHPAVEGVRVLSLDEVAQSIRRDDVLVLQLDKKNPEVQSPLVAIVSSHGGELSEGMNSKPFSSELVGVLGDCGGGTGAPALGLGSALCLLGGLKALLYGAIKRRFRV
ncbi:hypothetical protein cyc_03335 [Cyclospora cayetanensis]|uniref:Uncharacterized protein n=1 Tax=Cyclospora cayetanensis TaxID=88456 RepID=A0A1D3D6R3_9EIME|nr:hypothetical protein cyc_03335 [Cyclospora cayetanensis]